MKKLALIIIASLWIFSLLILILALTDFIQNNPFEEYKLIISIGFIAITGFLRIAYKQVIST